MDLVVAAGKGTISFIPNNGKTFGPPVPLTCNKKPIRQKYASPCAVDWDGDGTPDLLVGNYAGAVLFYKGAKGATVLSSPVPLVPEVKNVKATPTTQTGTLERERPDSDDLVDPRSQIAIHISVADWNGDGKRDLLASDVCYLKPRLTPEQARKYGEVKPEYDTVNARYQEIALGIRDELFKRTGLKSSTKAPKEEWDNYWKIQKELNKKHATEISSLSSRLKELRETLAPLEKKAKRSAFVWVYLRK
jgi:hypothetical protein